MDLILQICLFTFAFSRMIIVIGKVKPIYKSEFEIDFIYGLSYVSICIMIGIMGYTLIKAVGG